jgi:divalent metal cation (Fe/Co/Zn/Cd) transporter
MGAIDVLVQAVRALAKLRRHSRVGAYAAIASIPSAVTLAALLWKWSAYQRTDEARLIANKSDTRAQAVVAMLRKVATYKPTPWMLVSPRFAAFIY